MWLSKDERRLLAGYYSSIGDINTERVYQFRDLAQLLRFRGHRRPIREYHDSGESSNDSKDFNALKREISQYIDACHRIEKANNLLAARELIARTPHQHEIHVVCIALSVAGYDLGRRYSNLFESTGLWFQEYRNHWIWLIVAFFGGATGAKLMDWVGSLLR